MLLLMSQVPDFRNNFMPIVMKVLKFCSPNTRLLVGYSAVEFLQLGRAGGLVWAVTITACIFFDGICVW